MRKVLLVSLVVALMAGFFNVVQAADDAPSFNLKGSRLAVGYWDTESDGSHRTGSYLENDMKLRFNINWDENNSSVVRMSLKNATFDKLDYFYLKSKNLLTYVMDNPPINPTVKLGRFKIGITEEWKSNNLVQSTVPSNSAANPSAYDEGIGFSQKVEGLPFDLGVVLAFMNGNDNAGNNANDNKTGKATYLELDAQLREMPLHVNLSYYDSGNLEAMSSEFSIAGLDDLPAGASEWERKVMGIEIRYDLEKGEKKLNPPAYNDSRAFVRLGYGTFSDEITEVLVAGTNPDDRDGKFMYVGAKYYLMPGKLYVAVRQSSITLDESTMYDVLNSVVCNEYKRMSTALGYHLTKKTIVKLGMTTNEEDMDTGVDEPDNNEWVLMIGTYY